MVSIALLENGYFFSICVRWFARCFYRAKPTPTTGWQKLSKTSTCWGEAHRPACLRLAELDCWPIRKQLPLCCQFSKPSERDSGIKLNLIHIKWRTCVSDWRGCWRQRNQELEEQNLEQQQQMALLHSEVERLRTDNVALYEKVRFLQSYSGNQVCTGMFDWLKIVYKPRCLRENFGLVDSALPRIPAPLVPKRRNSTNVSTRIVSILSPRSLAGSGNVN